MRFLLALVLCVLSASVFAQQITTAPLVGPWNYGASRCGGLEYGFPSEGAAANDGAYRFYKSTRTCPWSTYPNRGWGTPTSPTYHCTSTVPYPKLSFGGVESTNIRPYYVEYSFGTNCTSDARDGLSIFRTRSVKCPPGYTATATRCVRNAGVTDKAKDCKGCQAGRNGTNPIHNAEGYKNQTEVDFDLGGGLAFVRYYSSNSDWRATALGENWRHNYLGEVLLTPAYSTVPVTAWVRRPDGDQYAFLKQADGTWKPEADVTVRLTATYSAPGVVSGWILTDTNNRIETYDAQGRLVRIERPGARPITLEYNANFNVLEVVSDDRGRSIIFLYDTEWHLSTVVEPTGDFHYFQYDGLNNLASVMRRAKGSTTGPIRVYHYENSALPAALTGITDENGDRYATWAYNAAGQAILSVHGESSGTIDRHEMTFVANGPTTVKDPLGTTRTYTFVESFGVRRIASVDKLCPNCGGNTAKAWTYDANGNVNVTTDFLGVTTDYDYNVRGLVERVVESANQAATRRKAETTWHATLPLPLETRLYDATDVLVGKRQATYNGRGEVLTSTVIDVATGASRTSSMTYCEPGDVASDPVACPIVGLLRSVDGPRTDVADVVNYTYYAEDSPACVTDPAMCSHRRGDLWKATNAAGHVSEVLGYDASGRIKSLRKPDGAIVDLEYDYRGRLARSSIRGLTSATEITYDHVGQVVGVTRSDGVSIQLDYDAAHRLVGMSDASGSIIYTLDALGNRTNEEVRNGASALTRKASAVFNELGQLVSAINGVDQPTHLSYDANGAGNTVTDALGRVGDADVDALGRVIRSVANANGSGVEKATSQFAYDGRGNLAQVIDPKGLATSYAYNGFDELVSLTSPDTGLKTYAYDTAGLLASKTDARGITENRTYDALGRVLSRQVPTSTQNVTYAYDTPAAECVDGEHYGTGRLSAVTDESGSTHYCYDRQGHVVRKVQAVTQGSSLTVGATYDGAGNLVAMTYPSGAIVTFTRNASGQIRRVDANPSAGAAQVTLVSSVTYQPFGPIASIAYGNGRTQFRGYDLDYGIKVLHDGVLGEGLSENYALDAVGNVVAVNERTSMYRTFEYDGLDRLTALKNGATTVEAFAYDATGNRVSKAVGASTQTYGYNGNSHRLNNVSGWAARSYDANGNTTLVASGAPLAYTYDDHNRMRTVTFNGVLHRTYQYNGMGERVLRVMHTNTAGSLQFVYDEAGHLLGEYYTNGSRFAEYVWVGDVLVGVLRSHDGSTHQYVETDHLGTPRAIIHPVTNQVLWRWDLTPTAFGDHQPNSDADGNAVLYHFWLRYPGQYYDGLDYVYYNYYRDYDARTGRYMESDPIGLNGGASTYGYVEENPLLNIDPLGLNPREGKITVSRKRLYLVGNPERITMQIEMPVNQCDSNGRRFMASLHTDGLVRVGYFEQFNETGSVNWGDGQDVFDPSALEGNFRIEVLKGSRTGHIYIGSRRGTVMFKKAPTFDFRMNGTISLDDLSGLPPFYQGMPGWQECTCESNEPFMSPSVRSRHQEEAR